MLKILLLVGLLKASPHPYVSKALQNINKVGPELMLSVSKYIDMNCNAAVKKDIECLIPTVYADYLVSATYLAEKSGSVINDLYIPEDISSVDYRATNWHLSPFSQRSTHTQIVEHIYKIEVSKHLLSMLVSKFGEKLESIYRQIPEQFRYVQIPLLKAWLSGTSRFTQYYYFAENQSCLPSQTLCLEQKSNYRASVSAVRNSAETLIQNTKNMILNYSPQPWEEAELLKQVYELDQHIIQMKKLNIEKLISLWSGDDAAVPGLRTYLTEIQKITSTPKSLLLGAGDVELYREVIRLRELERIPAQSISGRINTELSTLLETSIGETLNTVGQFYLNREREITDEN